MFTNCLVGIKEYVFKSIILFYYRSMNHFKLLCKIIVITSNRTKICLLYNVTSWIINRNIRNLRCFCKNTAYFQLNKFLFLFKWACDGVSRLPWPKWAHTTAESTATILYKCAMWKCKILLVGIYLLVYLT